MKVPLLDLSAQHSGIREDLGAALVRVLEGGTYILGPEVGAFEQELALALGSRKVVGVSSGTDALLVSLMALGVKAGDEVITTPFSFFATTGCIARLGAKPVFSDIETGSFNLDPAAAVAKVSTNTKVFIPVHLFGRLASLPLTRLPIIEDAAQAIAAGPVKGKVACYSFFPSKNLGCLGDGGAVATNDDDLADAIALLRGHGSRPKYTHLRVGGNFRLDAIQAAVLRVKLPRLAGWTLERRRNADRYRAFFAAQPGIPPEVRLPSDSPDHIYNQFVIRVPRRDALREFLGKEGVGTEVYYPLPLHLQPCFEYLGYKKGSMPVAEKASEEVLALPIFPELTENQQAYVVERIAALYGRG